MTNTNNLYIDTKLQLSYLHPTQLNMAQLHHLIKKIKYYPQQTCKYSWDYSRPGACNYLSQWTKMYNSNNAVGQTI